MTKSRLFLSTSEDIFSCLDSNNVIQRQVSRYGRFNSEQEATEQTKPVIKKLEGYNIFYFEPFLTVLYYMGLVPYLPERQGDIVIFKKNRVQQIIWISIKAGGITRLLQRFNNTYPDNIYENPTVIFAIVGLFTQTGYIVWLTYSFWFKEDILRKLLSRKRPATVDFKTKAKSIFFPTLFIFLTIISIFWRLIRGSSGEIGVATKYIGTCIESAFEGETVANHTTSQSCNIFRLLKSVGHITILTCGALSVNCFEVLVLLFIVSGYELTKSLAVYSETTLKAVIHTPEALSVSHLKCILNVVQELHDFFSELNQFGSGFFLRVFCLLVPWISYRLLDSLPGVTNSVLADVIYNWVYFLLYGSIMIFAAEIKKQGDIFTDNIITVLYRNAINWNCKSERLAQLNPTVVSVYIQHALKDVCLKGGSFFNISYGFLGSVVGIVITYTLFALQLNYQGNRNILP